jgi:hypothetical protein
MSTDAFLGSGAGVDIELSAEQRRWYQKAVRAIEKAEKLSYEVAKDRHMRRMGGGEVFKDELPGFGTFKSQFELPALGLPGFGEEREDCGVEIPHCCSDCGHPIAVGRTCAQSRCPRCAPAWVTRRAPNAVSRVTEAARMISANLGGQSVPCHHVVVSPPEDWLIDVEADGVDDPLDETFHVVRDILDGFDAEGLVAYHPWSGNDDLEDDRGEWKNRLFAGREWDDVREELKKRPHFHCIVAAPFIPGQQVTAAIYEATGWVVHRVTRNGSAVSLGDIHNVARATTYSLSHVGIDCRGEQNRAQYRLYGSHVHKADCRSIDEARRAVHDVAPETLGVGKLDVECRSKVPADPDDEYQQELVDEDGSAESSESSEPTAESDGLTTCRGSLVDIEEAKELLNDEDWRAQAPPENVEQLERIREKWDELGGWRGWIDADQTTLDFEEPPPD